MPTFKEYILEEDTEIESFAKIVKRKSWVKKVVPTGEGVDIFIKDDPKDRIYVEFDEGQYRWEDFSSVVPLGNNAKKAVKALETAMKLSLDDRAEFEKKYKR